MTQHNFIIVNGDTDSIAFKKPDEKPFSQEEQDSILAELNALMPKNIVWKNDKHYRRVIVLKAKNYVLVTYEGKKTFKGSSLRSRADERFGRRFLGQAVDLLLAENRTELAALYADLQAKIESRELGIEDIARRERVTEKTFSSEARKRSATAMVGLSVGDYAIL